jgi:hypothetical protein
MKIHFDTAQLLMCMILLACSSGAGSLHGAVVRREELAVDKAGNIHIPGAIAIRNGMSVKELNSHFGRPENGSPVSPPGKPDPQNQNMIIATVHLRWVVSKLFVANKLHTLCVYAEARKHILKEQYPDPIGHPEGWVVHNVKVSLKSKNLSQE